LSDSVTILRQEFPALGLVLGFAAPQERSTYADLLLLWIEINRARSSAETLIVAARITWWRDAMAEGKPEGVPLASNLLNHQRITQAQFADILTRIIDLTLQQSPEVSVQLAFGDLFAQAFDCEAIDAGHILHLLKTSLGGHAVSGGDGIKNKASLPKTLRLIHWLCEKPSRLHYPEEHPMLALSMLWASLKV